MHVHHSGRLPFEILTEPIEVRADYIKKYKPSREVELRLRLMKVIEEEPPEGVLAVLAAWAECSKVCDAALAEYDKAWAECSKVCDAASTEYDKAWAECFKVRDAASTECSKVCNPAWAEYLKVCDVHAIAIAAFHKKVCVPDCPWTPENQTIFPKEGGA